MENNDNFLKENLIKLNPEQLADLKVENDDILMKADELIEECNDILNDNVEE